MAMFMIIRWFFIVSSREGVKTDNSVYGVTHTAFTKSLAGLRLVEDVVQS